ncbi:MAG: linear amide C-N hydrolase [Acidimicrobiia bacterium]
MCTNFKHPQAADGTVCVGRTMEFPDVLPWQLGVIASDLAGQSQASANAKSWTAKYGVVGMSAFNQPSWMADGINTAGLSAHVLYMPGHCTYQAAHNDGTDIGALEIVAYVLGTCATTAEARATIEACNVVEYKPSEIPVSLPLHLIVHDATSCIVAEFHPDGMRVLDNPVQIATNAPYLEWHLTNVTNYLSLTPDNPAPIEIGGTTFAPAGQGQGFRGLPADENSSSRFIRLLAQVRFATPPTDAKHAVMDTIRILHGFDLVPGTVMEDVPGGKQMPLLTMWSTVSNLTANTYAYNTIDDPTWYEIDLKTTDFSTSRSIEFTTSGWLTPATI